MLPGSRTLLAWWRELGPLHPRHLWLSQLLLHRIEALVEIASPRQLDPFRLTLLRGLALDRPHKNSVPVELHLDQQVLARLLHSLASDGLLTLSEGTHWELTPWGRAALMDGTYRPRARERRVFHFADNSHRGRPAHFVRLAAPLRLASPAPEGRHFDANHLRACVERDPDWKRRHGFPEDIVAILDQSATQNDESSDWRRVILDSPEQVPIAFAEISAEGEGTALLGYPVRAPDWTLRRDAPVISLRAGWEEVFVDLAEEPSPDAWRQAWQAWCQPRSLPADEVEACRLERADHRLLVRAPKRLVERLRTARSDVFINESWLLAGDDRTRTAARVELVEAD
jgi:hypothetical protein